ncbi:uncharacterized protein LOC134655658 [Cydia amplana]|uniref:uncharacterized protein LOC134655658 n=1 Tax=Cydia amplana TaxID=1869771 RepID=UPI002FE55F19
MLCRALLAAAVFTCTLSRGSRPPTLNYIKGLKKYTEHRLRLEESELMVFPTLIKNVLCVLLLSGVQKEDIDASTLRKLQRHNVNIDDINDQQLKTQCLGKTDIPVTLTTPLTNPTTEKTKITVTDKNGLPAEDTTPLQKIFEYLDFLNKEEKRKALESKDNDKKIKQGQKPFSLLSSSPFRDRIQGIKVEDLNTETPLTITTTSTKKDDEKSKMEKNINSELETLMNVLRTNIGRTPDLSQQGSTTVKTSKDLPVSEHTKDVDYIQKIVEEIMSKRQLKEVNRTKSPNLNTNESMRNIDDIQSKNKSISLISYYLNNYKLGNFYANNQGDKDTYDILDTVKRLKSSINEPDGNNNDEYSICNKLKAQEQKVVPGQNGNPIINNILSKLKEESERFKLLDKESAIRTIMEHEPQTTHINQNNDKDKFINNKEGLNIVDKEYITALGNESKSISVDGLRGHIKINDVYKDVLEVSDTESDTALKNVLQSQSKLFNQIFNQQRNLIKLCNTDKEKLKSRENESPEPLQSALKSQLNNEQNKPMATMQQSQDNYPTYINENIHKLEPELGHEQAKFVGQSRLFHYSPSKSDNNVLNEKYKSWQLTAPNSFIIEDQATEPKNNFRTGNWMDDKLKTTNRQNSIDHDPDLVKDYKRPWFYAELNNKQFKFKTNGNQQGLYFIPNRDNKMTSTVEPRLKKSYEKSWSPYFDIADNNTAVIRTNEHLRANKEQPILVDPSLTRSNVRELMDSSKKYPMIDGTYQYENKYRSDIEDRSSEQLKTKQDKKINIVNCQTFYETRVECLSAAEYKKNWGNFRNKQNNIKMTNMRENNEETETLNNNIKTKHKNYRLPSRPTTTEQHLDSDTTLGQFKTNIDDDDFFSQNETKESKKIPSLSPNVIKDIAQSIKEYVLRDLKTTTTTITPSSTTTYQMTTTTPTTITKTVKSTTKEEMLTTSTKDPLKIQDASKTLEKMMEMLAKITSMKNTGLEPENVKHVPYNINTTVTTQKTITQRHEQQIVSTDNTLRHQQTIQLEENRVSHVPQPLQQNVENLKAYVPQLVEMKDENLLPYGSQPLQKYPENHVPYVTQVFQRHPENQLAYDSQPLNLNPNHRVPYDTQPVQQGPMNRLPYEIQPLKHNLENQEISEPYVSPAVQLKGENRLRYYPHTLERNPENVVYVQQAPVNHSPYVPKDMQLNVENPTYVPQAAEMKAESNFQFDSQLLQNNQENLQHNTQSFQRNPEDHIIVPEVKTESRIQYFPRALQPKTKDRIPYDLQRLEPNPENHVTYPPAPLHLPHGQHAAELPPVNNIPYGSPAVRLKTEDCLPYNPKPLQNGSKNRPYDYSMMDPYHHSNIEFKTYLKEVQAPVPQNKVKPSSGNQVITVQTNSGEISPLKIVLQKPFLQNIVLTTQPPVKAHHSDETFHFKKPIQKQNRHQVEVKESEMNNINEDKGYVARHTHRDTKTAVPKSRKTKKEREVVHHYKPRDLNEIEKFHEKLERGDARQREDEKITKRVQRPIVKNTNYDDTHFRNFLQTQQKVNAMLEKILASAKTKPISAEVI